MLKKSFFGVFFLGVVLLFGCSTFDNNQSDRGLAGKKDTSVVDSSGEVILFYRDGGKIVVKECMEETVLKDSSYKRRDCLQKLGTKVREIPLKEFKEDLKRILRIPNVTSNGRFDRKTEGKIELYKKLGRQDKTFFLEHQKKRIEEILGTLEMFLHEYSVEGSVKSKEKQVESAAHLGKIRALLKKSGNLAPIVTEINGLIDTLVELKGFSFIRSRVKPFKVRVKLFKVRGQEVRRAWLQAFPLAELREDLKKILRIPDVIFNVHPDGMAEEKTALHGRQIHVADLNREKREVIEKVSRTKTYITDYKLGYHSETAEKQKERRDRLDEIEAILAKNDGELLKESGGLASVIAEVNGLIDSFVNGVISQRDLKQFVSSRDERSIEFNLLKSYLRAPRELQSFFVPVKAGDFQMGSSEEEEFRHDDETLHKVTLTKAFEIQATEVTQSEWFRVMGENPSKFKPGKVISFFWGIQLSWAFKNYCPETSIIRETYALCPNHPVDSVSWNDVQTFIKKLNRMSDAYVYRLPTEAEWEYAAREEGRSKTPYHLGGRESLQTVNYNEEDPGTGKKREQTVAVGSLDNGNALGLFDMHGNVGEWVQDWYGSDTYEDGSVVDPKGPSSGKKRVVRGGSWGNLASYLRSAFRYSRVATKRTNLTGFRLVRTAK